MCYITNLNKKECTGCRACEQICPTKCIHMIEDKEGFFYPVKGEGCINCGKCEKICPINDKNNYKLLEQEVYVAKLKSQEEIQKSSSGGMFWAIINEFCDKNYVIFGVKYDENLNVVHDYVDSIEKANIFRKSKYVQSDIKDNYIKAKQFLEESKNVLFTGTPCQIAGLNKYLGKNYQNLLTVDLICHGVPSQKVFNKYIEYVENKYKSRVKQINFREKVLDIEGKWNSRNIKIEFENGQTIIEDSIKNPYLKGFHKALFYRPACATCKYANSNRVSDITIADCWGIENIRPERDANKGESLVIVNTLKGKEIFDKLKEKIDYEKLTIQFAIESNAQFREPTKFNKNREKFFRDLDKKEFDKLINTYTKIDNIILRAIRKIKQLIKKVIVNSRQ